MGELMDSKLYSASRNFLIYLFAFILLAISSSIVYSDTVETRDTSTAGRSLTQHIDDRGITLSIRNKAIGHSELDKSHINVTTVNGIVLLTGEVPSARAKEIVEEVAQNNGSVRQVVNELRVTESISAKDILHDQWIKSRIRIRLGRVEEIPENRIIVVVSNDVAYLMGIVTEEIAKYAAEAVRTTKGVDRVISVFEIQQNPDN